jgi:hypothetical protein
MRFLALTATLFGLLGQVQAQHHSCLFDHGVQQREEQSPGYRQAFYQEQRQAAQRGQQQRHLRSTYTIPVVVHVVWKDSVQRLNECKIIEQIDILNEDYQRLNADTGNLRSIFQSVAASPNIRFRLDSIIWKQSDTLFYSTGFLPDPTIGDKVKRNSSGGSNGLPHQQYLNIWICNLGPGGVLGFAYLLA